VPDAGSSKKTRNRTKNVKPDWPETQIHLEWLNRVFVDRTKSDTYPSKAECEECFRSGFPITTDPFDETGPSVGSSSRHVREQGISSKEQGNASREQGNPDRKRGRGAQANQVNGTLIDARKVSAVRHINLGLRDEQVARTDPPMGT
jgi:hypothetical protein